MHTDFERAEHLTRRRARMLPVLAVLLLTQQTVFLSPEGTRAVDGFKIGAWVVLTAALLLVLATGGGLFRSAPVRALLNDETTKLHRLRACALGFWVAMGCGIAVYLLAQLVAITPREAVHVVVTGGLTAALLSFAKQERRALQ
jgi:ABC-type microcin C transport system permease subunit YejB